MVLAMFQTFKKGIAQWELSERENGGRDCKRQVG